MKKIIFFLLLIPALSKGQIKMSDFPTYIGNPNGSYVPVIINNTNRKIDPIYFGFNKIDSNSISFGTTYDTLYSWKMGVKSFYTLSRAETSSASPAFTGTPTTPTASANTNNTQIATTAYADRIRSQLLNSIDSATTAATIHTIVQQGGGAKIYRSVSANVDSLRSIGNGPGLTVGYQGDTLIRIALSGTGVQIINTAGSFAINDSTGSVYAYSADTIYLPSPLANQGRTIEINNVGVAAINIYTIDKLINANGGILYWAGFTSLISLPTHKNVRIRASGGQWYMVGGNL